MKNARLESGTVLVVNSEEAICNVVRQALERADYRVLEVHDAEEALEICREQMEQIDLLLAEVTLPRVRGRTLVEWAATLRPRMKVIYMSRNVDLFPSQGVLTPGMAYLRKPFTGTEVLRKVTEVLRPYPHNRQITCPRCSSANVLPSRRGWFDWLATLLFVVPYRCRDCRNRFLRFRVKLRSLCMKATNSKRSLS
jgi:DNA-binding response OmpR family regulator